jgi:hypothetical protein
MHRGLPLGRGQAKQQHGRPGRHPHDGQIGHNVTETLTPWAQQVVCNEEARKNQPRREPSSAES